MKRSVAWTVTEGGRVPVARVAARTLRKRLETVWSELRGACRQRHDPERVHQLRVATRRTLAALAVFRDLVPARRRRWFEKRLRRIRRAAAMTRDLDVLTGHLSEPAAADRAAEPRLLAARARRRLVTMLAKRRDLSREPIRQVREACLAADWPGRVERLIEGIGRRDSSEPFAAYARWRFPVLLERFFSRADRKLTDAAEIHRLRIAGKKLRYALEIFAPVFPAATRTACLEALEMLQETLGRFTDHAAAADRFRRWAREDGVGADRETLAALRRLEDRRAEKARRAFVKWWKPGRRRELRRRFEQTLERESA
jgi:CHAD domain-containing protein